MRVVGPMAIVVWRVLCGGGWRGSFVGRNNEGLGVFLSSREYPSSEASWRVYSLVCRPHFYRCASGLLMMVGQAEAAHGTGGGSTQAHSMRYSSLLKISEPSPARDDLVIGC